MDQEEKMVLRRKRLTIALQVDITTSYLKQFKDSGVPTGTIMAGIEKRIAVNGKRRKPDKRTESIQFQKIMKFLELLPQYANNKTFPLLVTILEQHYFWLGEELKAELLAEKNLLNIEDYIENLAHLLVYEKFGKTVRLTLKEKAAIKDLVARRIQYAKEVCRERLSILQIELESCRERGNLLDLEMFKLVTKIKEEKERHGTHMKILCLQHHKERSGETGEGTDTDDDKAGKDLDSGEDAESNLRNEVYELMEMLNKTFGETEFLGKGRAKALQVLKAPSEDADLDEELKKVLQKLVYALRAKTTLIDEKDSKCKELRHELHYIYSQIRDQQEDKEIQMLEMSDYLGKANDMMRLILDDIELLRKEYRFCKQKLGQYKTKFVQMERTRHLGYLSISAPNRANLAEVVKDKARAKAPIKKPRIIKVQQPHT